MEHLHNWKIVFLKIYFWFDLFNDLIIGHVKIFLSTVLEIDLLILINLK